MNLSIDLITTTVDVIIVSFDSRRRHNAQPSLSWLVFVAFFIGRFVSVFIATACVTK